MLTKRPARVEVLVLWWWVAICVSALLGVFGRSYPLIGLAGVLMIGLGLFVALDSWGVAGRLTKFRLPVQQSAGARGSRGPFWL
jgi:hypothetical protein